MTCLLVSNCSLRGQLLAGLVAQCCAVAVAQVCGSVDEAIAAIDRTPPVLLILDWDGADDGCERLARHLLACRGEAHVILLSTDVRLASLRRDLSPQLLAADTWPALQAAVLASGPFVQPSPAQEPLPDVARLESLRPRERMVLQLLGAGLVTREIAAALGLSLQTVETYRKNLGAKLGVSGARLVRVAVLASCLTQLGCTGLLSHDGAFGPVLAATQPRP